MRQVNVIGVGITKFGKAEQPTLRALGSAAIHDAIADSGLAVSEIELVVHGSAMAGLMSGQEMIRGQVVTADSGLTGAALINVENACATSSTGLHVALNAIRAGEYDTAVVCGTEVMTSDKRAAISALTSGADVERLPEYNRRLTGRDGPAESFFMEVYAKLTRDYMGRTGATPDDFAEVAAKNSYHGSLNPKAQYGTPVTVKEVLASRMIADPVTMLMCSPIADGAAAVVLQADDVATDRSRAVRVRACALRTGIPDHVGPVVEERTAHVAYEQAGLGPEDLDVLEIHDAASPNELMVYEELGLAEPGKAAVLLRCGATRLGGRVPVNPSGGLVSRGHPVGATGCAQIVELVTQLRGEAGARQVAGARIGLAENAGGYVNPESAACVVTILSSQ
jgi:acetyl-CoA acetyltransferase